jgi:hypothetical protein
MTRDKAAASWRHYLGSAPASPYAAPARADDLSGLPPPTSPARSSIRTDEAIGYAQGLQAGVSVELHQWPGTFHGRKRSCLPRCPSGKSPNSPPPCAVPWPGEMVGADHADHPCHNSLDERSPQEGHPGMTVLPRLISSRPFLHRHQGGLVHAGQREPFSCKSSQRKALPDVDGQRRSAACSAS